MQDLRRRRALRLRHEQRHELRRRLPEKGDAVDGGRVILGFDGEEAVGVERRARQLRERPLQRLFAADAMAAAAEPLAVAVIGRDGDGDADVGVEQIEGQIVDEADLGREVGVGAVELHQRPADRRTQQLRLRDLGAIGQALDLAAGLDPGLAEADAEVGRGRHDGASARA